MRLDFGVSMVGRGWGRRRVRIGPQAENRRLCCQPVVITNGANRIAVDVVVLCIGLSAGKFKLVAFLL